MIYYTYIIYTLLFFESIESRSHSRNIFNHHSFLLATTPNSVSCEEKIPDIASTYAKARNIRLEYGHMAAVPIYQSLLRANEDFTAATRIAAAKSSPYRHDQACPLPSKSNDRNDEKVRNSIQELRSILEKTRFDNRHIQSIFGIPTKEHVRKIKSEEVTKRDMLAFANCPIYLKAQGAGSQSVFPSILDGLQYSKNDTDTNSNLEQPEIDKHESSLKCMVALFLLGLAVPKALLIEHLIGGEETLALFEYLGLLFPCEIDPSLMVPYVHIFPIDVDLVDRNISEVQRNGQYRSMDSVERASVILVTDCHPKVLSQTTVGQQENGAVMYIGPDSLALVHCLPLQPYFSSLKKEYNRTETFRALDICTGSGVQGISTLVSLKSIRPDASIVFVDVNDRALQFARFNALLNGIADEKILLINKDITTHEDFISEQFDIILANPPFIPIPRSELIQKRYGLFSSGGSRGDDVLCSLIQKAPLLLKPEIGLLGIVSEFMNPPEEGRNLDVLHDIQNWWNSANANDNEQDGRYLARCILFTNEFPITASIYASRRADDEEEDEVWFNHLQSNGIDSISPGLLFLKLSSDHLQEGYFENKIVPRSRFGSIWTPFNVEAVDYIEKLMKIWYTS